MTIQASRINANDVCSSGQNLASIGSSGNLGSAADAAANGIANQWYKEISDFHYFGQPNPTQDFDKWGHFTQVVWKDTREVGCATVKCAAGTVLGLPSMYTVCNYAPAGKYPKHFVNETSELILVIRQLRWSVCQQR